MPAVYTDLFTGGKRIVAKTPHYLENFAKQTTNQLIAVRWNVALNTAKPRTEDGTNCRAVGDLPGAFWRRTDEHQTKKSTYLHFSRQHTGPKWCFLTQKRVTITGTDIFTKQTQIMDSWRVISPLWCPRDDHYTKWKLGSGYDGMLRPFHMKSVFDIHFLTFPSLPSLNSCLGFNGRILPFIL